jgi:hypothetical protein
VRLHYDDHDDIPLRITLLITVRLHQDRAVEQRLQQTGLCPLSNG